MALERLTKYLSMHTSKCSPTQLAQRLGAAALAAEFSDDEEVVAVVLLQVGTDWGRINKELPSTRSSDLVMGAWDLLGKMTTQEFRFCPRESDTQSLHDCCLRTPGLSRVFLAHVLSVALRLDRDLTIAARLQGKLEELGVLGEPKAPSEERCVLNNELMDVAMVLHFGPQEIWKNHDVPHGAVLQLARIGERLDRCFDGDFWASHAAFEYRRMAMRHSSSTPLALEAPTEFERQDIPSQLAEERPTTMAPPLKPPNGNAEDVVVENIPDEIVEGLIAASHVLYFVRNLRGTRVTVVARFDQDIQLILHPKQGSVPYDPWSDNWIPCRLSVKDKISTISELAKTHSDWFLRLASTWFVREEATPDRVTTADLPIDNLAFENDLPRFPRQLQRERERERLGALRTTICCWVRDDGQLRYYAEWSAINAHLEELKGARLFYHHRTRHWCSTRAPDLQRQGSLWTTLIKSGCCLFLSRLAPADVGHPNGVTSITRTDLGVTVVEKAQKIPSIGDFCRYCFHSEPANHISVLFPASVPKVQDAFTALQEVDSVLYLSADHQKLAERGD